jgi:hypothetical protein
MRASRPLPTRPAAQRSAVLLVVLALALAPALAGIWPALGRGPMLYVGEPVRSSEATSMPTAHEFDRASHLDHVAAHDGHVHGHGGDAPADRTEGRAADDSGHREDGAAAHAHERAADSQAVDGSRDGRDAHAGHAQHCALCVLVAQSWAPVVHFDAVGAGVAAAQRVAPAAPAVFEAAWVWPRAQPRGPPPIS